MNLLYVPFIGFPLCVMFMSVGLFLCLTIIGIPLGLSLMALGVKMLTLKPRPRYVR